MASTSPQILLAGALKEFSPMSGLLARQGFQVESCADGAKALELALTFNPRLVVVDAEIGLLPAPKLVQILRTNPRTGETCFFFVGPEGTEVEGFRPRRDRFIPRPFNVEQVLAEIQGFFTRSDRSVPEAEAARSVEGSLKQIPLVDLLQVFGLNRKDGILTLSRGKETGAVFLTGGRVVNAEQGRVAGEKAFFRLLRWEEGEFRFLPSDGRSEVRIRRSLDHLIMEGLRQKDELAAQADRFPAGESFLALNVPPDRLPSGLRPATQEVLLLLENYPRVGDLLDHCSRSDLEVLQILRLLMEKELVELGEKRAGNTARRRERSPLLLSEEVIALKDVLGEGDILLQKASAKVILLVTCAEDIERFLQALQGIDEFEPEVEWPVDENRQVLGDIGRLAVSDTFYLRLFALPAAPEASPLWGPFCRRLFGVVSVGGRETVREAENFFLHTVKTPLARVSLDGAEEGMFVLQRGNRSGLRKLLGYFAAQLPGRKPEREDA